MARCGQSLEGEAETPGCGASAALCWDCSNLPSWQLFEARRHWLENHDCLAREELAIPRLKMIRALDLLHEARFEMYEAGLKGLAGELSLAIRPIERLHSRLKSV